MELQADKIPTSSQERLQKALRLVKVFAENSEEKLREKLVAIETATIGSNAALDYNKIYTEIAIERDKAIKNNNQAEAQLLEEVGAVFYVRNGLLNAHNKGDSYDIPEPSVIRRSVNSTLFRAANEFGKQQAAATAEAQVKEKKAKEDAFYAPYETTDLGKAVVEETRKRNLTKESKEGVGKVIKRIETFLKKHEGATLDEQLYALEQTSQSDWYGIWPWKGDIKDMLVRADEIKQERLAPKQKATQTAANPGEIRIDTKAAPEVFAFGEIFGDYAKFGSKRVIFGPDLGAVRTQAAELVNKYAPAVLNGTDAECAAAYAELANASKAQPKGSYHNAYDVAILALFRAAEVKAAQAQAVAAGANVAVLPALTDEAGARRAREGEIFAAVGRDGATAPQPGGQEASGSAEPTQVADAGAKKKAHTSVHYSDAMGHGDAGLARAAAADNFKLEARTSFKSNPDKAHVERLQAGLERVGIALSEWGVDGKFGNETKQAVLAFQKREGLPETGVADSATLAMLQVAEVKALAAQYNKGTLTAEQKKALTAEAADVAAVGSKLTDKARQELQTSLAGIVGQLSEADGAAFVLAGGKPKTNGNSRSTS